MSDNILALFKDASSWPARPGKDYEQHQSRKAFYITRVHGPMQMTFLLLLPSLHQLSSEVACRQRSRVRASTSTAGSKATHSSRATSRCSCGPSRTRRRATPSACRPTRWWGSTTSASSPPDFSSAQSSGRGTSLSSPTSKWQTKSLFWEWVGASCSSSTHLSVLCHSTSHRCWPPRVSTPARCRRTAWSPSWTISEFSRNKLKNWKHSTWTQRSIAASRRSYSSRQVSLVVVVVVVPVLAMRLDRFDQMHLTLILDALFCIRHKQSDTCNLFSFQVLSRVKTQICTLWRPLWGSILNLGE